MTLRDLRIAIRYLRKTPGFTATAVLMLAESVSALPRRFFRLLKGYCSAHCPFPVYKN